MVLLDVELTLLFVLEDVFVDELLFEVLETLLLVEVLVAVVDVFDLPVKFVTVDTVELLNAVVFELVLVFVVGKL